METKLIDNFNLNTLAINKELNELFEKEINLLLTPTEISENAVVGAIWDASGGPNMCPLCSHLNGQIFPVESGEFGRLDPPIHQDCLVSGRSPIYTIDGWKKVRNIKRGDFVLTHKGRFQKVTRLYRGSGYKDEVITITLKGSGIYLTITPNHPILTKNGWKEASDLKKSDLVAVLATKCRRCRKLIPYNRTYCSHSCLSKDITDRQWSNPKHRERISKLASKRMYKDCALGIRDPYKITEAAHEKVREIIASDESWGWQNPEHLKKSLDALDRKAMSIESSERMKKYNPMNDPIAVEKARITRKETLIKHPERHPNFIMAQKGHITKIEKKMGNILKDLGISAQFQYPLNGYFIDWAIPNLKIAIEVDGHYWHRDDRKKKDALRQKKIENLGWTVIRFGEDEINERIDKCYDRINRLVLNHAHQFDFTYLPIKKIKTHRHTYRGYGLFNFAVEEDESYIVKGIVSHNCHCILRYPTGRQRGIQERLKEYKPVDPDLLAKWSSKVFTKEEIREMVIAHKAFPPEEGE